MKRRIISFVLTLSGVLFLVLAGIDYFKFLKCKEPEVLLFSRVVAEACASALNALALANLYANQKN